MNIVCCEKRGDRMNRKASVLGFLLCCLVAPVRADHQHAPAQAAATPPPLFDDLGTLHHPITTASPQAQKYFDQGLRLVYAFNHDEATRAFKEAAVRQQDELQYEEPPPWYYPVRQSLGAVLLQAGRAEEAEAVYREDLKRNPENGWSLYGLLRSLQAQKKKEEAAEAEQRFRKAWARADVKLTASRF
jgi:tetratricopeptide (TPR) repeat protein